MPGRVPRSVLVVTLLVLSGLTGTAPVPAAEPPQAQRWTLVAEDQFSGSLAPHWSAYQGTPPCCHQTTWLAGQAVVRDGRLILTSTKRSDGTWVTGGVSAAGWPAAVRTYGKYVARVRTDRGTGVSAVALLWPLSNRWPPEIDYYELSGADGARTQETATVHRSGGDGGDLKRQSVYRGDLTRWHTVSLEWLPKSITYFVDDREIGRVTDPAFIPHQPMWPAFQMQVGATGAGGSSRVPVTATGPVSMAVDWFAVYAPMTASAASPPGTGSSWWLGWATVAGGVVLVLAAVWLLFRRRPGSVRVRRRASQRA